MSGIMAGPMPIYEYRCPEGHTFERFQSMTAPAPEKCDVCGASPVELVLYPVAIHYKGSGFYTTDYKKKEGGGESKSDSKSESKPAESPKPASSSSSSSSSTSSD
jgi:putative FmdB family regulatory protein